MSQEHVTVEEVEFGVFEIYPLTREDKTKLCEMLDKRIGTDYEVDEANETFDVVVFDIEEEKEVNLIFEFVDKINEKITNQKKGE